MEAKKSANANLESKRAGFFQLGIIVATGLSLAAFEYTTFDKKETSIVGTRINDVQEEMVLDIKKPEPKPEPPKHNRPNPNPNPNPNSNPITGTTVVINNNPTNPNPPVIIGDSFNVYVPPVDPVFEPEEFTIVEDWPYFPEFKKVEPKEGETIPEARKRMTEKKMYQIFGEHIVYPVVPRTIGVQGKVHVSFRINKQGEIDDIKIAKGVHPDLDKEAMRIVSKLPKMEPGRQRGKEVNVRYTIPIKFTLR